MLIFCIHAGAGQKEASDGRLGAQAGRRQDQEGGHEQTDHELFGNRGKSHYMCWCLTYKEHPLCEHDKDVWLRGSRTSHMSQGYVEAAQTFQQESLTQPGIDLAAITDRMEIRKAVQSGNVEEAIERVNDLNPEVRTILYSV